VLRFAEITTLSLVAMLRATESTGEILAALTAFESAVEAACVAVEMSVLCDTERDRAAEASAASIVATDVACERATLSVPPTEAAETALLSAVEISADWLVFAEEAVDVLAESTTATDVACERATLSVVAPPPAMDRSLLFCTESTRDWAAEC